ncbi:MAG: hypothetical protein ABIG92_00280, partial [Candidatus Omnitrophota bacterium]
DAILAAATAAGTARQGYYFEYSLDSVNEFSCTARPALTGTTGTRIFFVDETGVIRLNDAGGPPIQ